MSDRPVAPKANRKYRTAQTNLLIRNSFGQVTDPAYRRRATMKPVRSRSQWRGRRGRKKRPSTMTRAWERRLLDAERQLPLFGVEEMAFFEDLLPGIPTTTFVARENLDGP